MQTERETFTTIHSSWEDLDFEVNQIRDFDPEKPIWKQMAENPVTPESIQNLLDKGWLVITSATMRVCGYTRYFEGTGSIVINWNLSPHARDLTLCHEIVHAHYPLDTEQTEAEFRASICHKDDLENDIITEWYARQLRANPRILRTFAREFCGKFPDESYFFKPLIYDRASLLAFCLHSYNLDKALKKCPKPLRELPLLMDPPEQSSTNVPYPIIDSTDYKLYPKCLI